MTENLEAVFSLSDSRFNRGIDRILGALGKVETSSGRVSRRLQESFEAPIGSVTKLVGGFFAVDKVLGLLKQGLQITSDFERLDSGLSAVSSSSMDFARTQAFLRKLSDDLGVSYEALATSYRGLKAATNGTALEGKATEKIFTSVVHAGAALKLSNDDIKGSLLALTQMMSKGTVSAEELRGQLGERLPGAFKLMAQGLGVSEIQLNKMLQSGEVLAVDALPKLAEQLEKVYGSKAQANVNSMTGGWTRATDQLKLFVAEFSQTHGIDVFFAKLGNGIANYLKLLREVQRTGGPVASYVPGFQKDLNTFNTFSPEQKASFLEKFGKNIKSKEAALTQHTQLAPSDENLAIEKQMDDEIYMMKQRYEVYRKAIQEERRKTRRERLLDENKPTVVAGFDIDKAKDQQSALAKRIQNLAGAGQSIPAKLQSDYDKLTAQIDRASQATQRQTSSSAASSVALTTNESILKRLTRELKEYGDTADKSRSNLVALFTEKVKQDKDRTNFKSVDLGNLKPAKNNISFAEAIGGLGGSVAPALPGVDKILNQIKQTGDLINEAYNEMRAAIKGAAADTAISMADGIGQVIAGIATGQTSALSGILNLITDFLSAYLNKIAQAKIIAGAALVAAGALSLDPFTIAQGTRNIQAGGLLKVAAGAVRVLGGYAASAAQPKGYEKGGLFKGESFIRVAETAKARAGGGELVTSVESGTNLIGKAIAKDLGLSGPIQGKSTSMTGGSASYGGQVPSSIDLGNRLINAIGQLSMGGRITTRIAGTDIELVLDRTKRSRETYGS